MKLPVEIKNYKSLRMLWRESLGKPLAIINGVLLGFTLLALVILPWVQTSRGTGKVSAFNPNDREQKIDSPIEGKIARWNVNEGSEVKLNDVIAEMSDFDPEFFPRLRSERDALAKRLSAAQQATLTAKKNLDRQKELFDEGLSAKREYEKAEIDYMGYLAS